VTSAWLGIWQPRRPLALRGARRRAADVAAARRALAMALTASGLSLEGCAVSRAHSRGAGAALVAAPGRALGVDVVAAARVSPRHAAEFLTRDEQRALDRHTGDGGGAALGWALKEAAAKATGAPERCFPRGLEIVAAANGALEVRLAGSVVRYRTGWLRRGAFLYAWALE
jgi:phosphopantetheinyl transferase (holo-ACP synthase)